MRSPQLLPLFLSRPVLSIFVILACIATLPEARGDIVLSMDETGNTSVNTGAAGAEVMLSVYISQDALSSDTLAVWVADFDLQAGEVTGGFVSATGTGTAGYLGAGNLNASDFTITSTTSFEINQESADLNQSIPQSPLRIKWFDVVIDTTGLPDGEYNLTLRDPTGTFLGSGGSFVTSDNNLSFVVSSIPEPASIHVAGLLVTLIVSRRRRSV